MPLIDIVIILAIVGFILWLINTQIPMESTIKKIMNAIVIICTVFWLLRVFGMLHEISNIKI